MDVKRCPSPHNVRHFTKDTGLDPSSERGKAAQGINQQSISESSNFIVHNYPIKSRSIEYDINSLVCAVQFSIQENPLTMLGRTKIQNYPTDVNGLLLYF